MRNTRFSAFFREASNNTLPCMECADKKDMYDSCFLKSNTERNLPRNHSNECDKLFKDYQQCLTSALRGDTGMYDLTAQAQNAST